MIQIIYLAVALLLSLNGFGQVLFSPAPAGRDSLARIGGAGTFRRTYLEKRKAPPVPGSPARGVTADTAAISRAAGSSVQKEALPGSTLAKGGESAAALLRTIPSILPVRITDWAQYRVSSGFGLRWHPLTGRQQQHAGIDLPRPAGTPVYATADGRVSAVLWDPAGMGLAVCIDHAGGCQTVYGHLSRQWVAVGQSVRRGQSIGAVGSTGRATGPHLHYTIRRGGRAVDPGRYCFLLLDFMTAATPVKKRRDIKKPAERPVSRTDFPVLIFPSFPQ